MIVKIDNATTDGKGYECTEMIHLGPQHWTEGNNKIVAYEANNAPQQPGKTLFEAHEMPLSRQWVFWGRN